MTFATVLTPEDVYDLVDARTERSFHMLELLVALGIVLIVVVAIQIIAKFVIWRRVGRLLEDNESLMREVKILVRIVQQEGRITDAEKARLDSVVEQAKEVRTAATRTSFETVESHIVKEVHGSAAIVIERTADRVIQKLKEKESGDSAQLSPEQAGNVPKKPPEGES